MSEITRLLLKQGDVSILWPLTPILVDLLTLSSFPVVDPLRDSQQAQLIRSRLLDLLQKGTILHQLFSKSVLRIAPEIVVKISRKKDVTELANLQHILACSQEIPIPAPLGMILINSTSYAFTSFVPGIPLDRIWTDMKPLHKAKIKLQLETIFRELRALPIPSEEGYLEGGSPLLCKDTRRWTRTSSSIIENETQFNEFLLTEAHGAPELIDFVRPCLRDDHRIVMTHGDLSARNILVNNEHDVKITGIIDWEYGGGYPEYWEYIKALNTVFFNDWEDWHIYIPENSIGTYKREYVVDEFIRRLVS